MAWTMFIISYSLQREREKKNTEKWVRSMDPEMMEEFYACKETESKGFKDEIKRLKSEKENLVMVYMQERNRTLSRK